MLSGGGGRLSVAGVVMQKSEKPKWFQLKSQSQVWHGGKCWPKVQAACTLVCLEGSYGMLTSMAERLSQSPPCSCHDSQNNSAKGTAVPQEIPPTVQQKKNVPSITSCVENLRRVLKNSAYESDCTIELQIYQQSSFSMCADKGTYTTARGGDSSQNWPMMVGVSPAHTVIRSHNTVFLKCGHTYK